MARIEVDENEWNRLTGVANLASQIHANPEGRKLLELAHKTVNPKAPTPALAQEEAFAAPIAAVQKQVADLAKLVTDSFEASKAEKSLAQISAQQEAAFDRLVREEGYRPEGIEAIKKIMSEKGLLDVDVAQAYFDRTNPPAAPITPTGSGSINFVEAFNDDSNKALNDLMQSQGNSESALNSLVAQSLNEFRQTAKPRR